MAERKTVFSDDRIYRYTLWREWEMPLLDERPRRRRYLNVIGLNPSTADEFKDDNTIRKCIKFAKLWGFSAYCMTNLFAYRATDPRNMKGFSKPIGPENDKWIVEVARGAGLVLAAWGKDGRFMARDEEVEKLLDDLECLGINGDGTPKHPLYIPYTTEYRTYVPQWMSEAVDGQFSSNRNYE